MRSHYRFHLFGVPEIFYNDQPLDIPRRQARQVLYYLVVADRPVARQTLIEILWPSCPATTTCRKRLRSLLGQLKRHLPGHLIISRGHDSISLDKAQIDHVDYLAFRQLAREKSSLLKLHPNALDSQKIWRQIARLFPDSATLLEGQGSRGSHAWQKWVRNKQQDLNRQYKTLFWIAIASAQHALSSEISDWLALMARHFAEDPDIQQEYTNFLCAANARQKLQYDRLARVAPGTDNSSASARPNIHRRNPMATINLPYIARPKETEQIIDRFKRGGSLAIYGEAGIGKRTLLRAAIQQIRQHYPNTRDVRISGYRMDQNTPYKAIRNAVEDNINFLMGTLNPQGKDILHKFIQASETDLPEPEDLVWALSQSIDSMSEQGPLVISVEDAHYLDQKTLELLNRIIPRMSRRKQLLAVTYVLPPPTLQANAFLKPKIHLEPLKLEEVAQIAQTSLGTDLTNAFIADLHAHTHGNPQYISEILARLTSNYRLEAISQMERLPASLQPEGAISPEQKQILYLLAAIERPIPQEKLGRICKQPAHTLQDTLDALRHNNLIKTTPHQGNYELVNPRQTRADFQKLPATEQRRYHLLIAEYLSQNRHGLQDAAMLAYHWEKGGYPSRAFDNYLRAARYAASWQSTPEALHMLERAIYILEQFPETLIDAQIYTLYTLLNEIAFNNNNAEIIAYQSERLEALASSRDHPSMLLAVAYNMRSNAALTYNDFAASERAAKIALEELDTLAKERTNTWPDTYQAIEAVERSNAWINLGVCHYMQNNFQAAQHYFENALHLIKQTPKTRSQEINLALQRAWSHTLYQIGFIYLFAGVVPKALQAQEEGLAIAHRIGWTYGQIIHFSLAAGCHFLQNRPHKGMDSARRGLERAKKIAAPRMEGYLHGYLSMNALEIGQIDTAWEHSLYCIRHGIKQNQQEIEAFGYRNLGNIFFRLNDFNTAYTYYQKGAQVAPQNNFLQIDCQVRSLISRCFQDFAGCWPQLQETIQEAQTIIPSVQGQALFQGMFAAAYDGHWVAMAWLSEQLKRLFVSRQSILALQPFLQLIQAEQSLKQNALPQAITLGKQAYEHFTHSDNASIWMRLLALNILIRAEGHAQWHAELNRVLASITMPPVTGHEAPQEDLMTLQSSWERYQQIAANSQITL